MATYYKYLGAYELQQSEATTVKRTIYYDVGTDFNPFRVTG